MCFLGSESFPHRRYLETVALRSLSQGTNAYTCTDHTVYHAASSSPPGLVAILAPFLDAVFRPLLTRADFESEVYNVDAEGKERGVVFNEMLSRERTEGDVLMRVLRAMLYGEDSPYAKECGGLTSCIPRLTLDEVKEYHRRFYSAANCAVVIVGPAARDEASVFAAIERARLAETNTREGARPGERAWARPVHEKLSELSGKSITARFPSQEEDTGSITFAWRGPNIDDLETQV